ncbi:hypothetical protein J8F10_08080 [Gemmata sp. G18]|uniref:Zinc finger/thioredoxin putative domain-containing protein n=1 Tax=Gemmata palustris TaxID=2822762 RepID=A0ABS5BNI2_9BACT|nr:MJ0042-type zinc finger domain-containing protein [Gemmata palustris]MBP3955238.1 hypothetical protein [Gemmata palustris]
MNNTCPSCGALYNVAEKDIGRRLKCKKCRTALMVTDAGLVAATGTESGPPEDQDFDSDLKESSFSRRRKKYLSGENPLAAIGGVPGLLFGIGVFFVLFFTFMQVLSTASTQRAVEYEKKVALEEEIRVRKLLPKGKKDRSELTAEEQKKYDDDKKKIEDEFVIQKREADEDKRYTEIGNKRSRLYEGYGSMLGFMLVSFGCLGFLRAQEALLLRIVAGIILTGMVLGLFRLALGTGAGIGVGVNVG